MPVSQVREPGSDARESLWSARNRGLTIGLVLTITLVAFEALAVATVMPIVAADLAPPPDRAGFELYGWVFSAFLLGSLIGIVVSGGIIDRRGLGGPFIGGIGLFAIGLVIGGFAPSMAILVLGRFIQGLGAGAVPPIAYVAIGRRLPEHLRPQMFATLSTAWVLPGVLGPAIAGYVGEVFDWRLVFLGLLPLIACSAAIAYPSVRAVTVPPGAADAERQASASFRRRFPLAVLIALGTGLLLAGLTSGEPVAVVVLVVAGLAIGLPSLRALTPPGTLRAAPGLPTAVLLRGLLTFAFFAVDAYVALALIDLRGWTALEAGLALTAATVSWTSGSWIQAHWSHRWPPDRFVRAGLIVVVAGLASFCLVLVPSIPPWIAIPTFAIAGLGMGLAYSPLALILLREAPPAEHGSASSALSLLDSLGTALGTGITGALVAMSVRDDGSPLQGLAAGFGVAIGVGLLGLVLSGRLRARVPEPASSPVVALR